MAEHSIEEPSSIVTDRELALIKCLNTQFPDSQHILCRWHVNMNVLAKTKRWFPAPIRDVNGVIHRHPQFQEFIQSWNTLLASPYRAHIQSRAGQIQGKIPYSRSEILCRHLATLEGKSSGVLYQPALSLWSHSN